MTGSMIAFIRLAIPFAALLLAAVYFPENLGWIYVITLTVIYLLTNIYIVSFLKTGYRTRFSLKSLHLYIISLPLGIVILALYFLGLGLILIAPYFFNTEIVATAFIGLKFYVIFKGAQRIIHQAFLKEMMRYEVCFKVDQICGLMGLTFMCFVICFPMTFIGLFFGEKYIPDKIYFILLAIAGLVNSMFSSLVTKAMLEKRDKPYSIMVSFAALLAILLCIIFSTFWHDAAAIGSSLLIGETVLVVSTLWILPRPGLLRERILFLVKNLPLVLIPLAIRYIMDDGMNPLIISAAVFATLLGLVHYRKFSTSLNDLTKT
jgi:O-antigen/teichoic acid export membrane protein